MRNFDLWKKVRFARRKLVVILVIFSATISILSGTSRADLTEIAKIVASDGSYSDFFGSSVSIDGDYAIIGAPNDDDIFTNTGCAYIFQRSGDAWLQQKKLLAPDRAANDTFGASVSISGNYAIVGSPFDDHTASNCGSAYVFKFNGSDWEQVAKLVASDPGANDYFGSSVAINGDYAIVGAPFDDDNGTDSGAAYIFHRNDSAWEQVAKLVPAELTAGDYFGYAVAIRGDSAVVGAPQDDNESSTDAGSIYIYRRSGETWSGWRYIDPDGAAGDKFGWSVSIDGQFAIGGALYHDGGDTLADSGSARIFEEAWGSGLWGTLTRHLLVPWDSAARDQFGFSVSISSDIAVVGTLKYLNGSGSVYVFRKSTGDDDWPQSEKLVASDGPWGFGSAVAASGRFAIVGAKWDINSAGSAYIYEIVAPPPRPSSGSNPAIPLLLMDE